MAGRGRVTVTPGIRPDSRFEYLFSWVLDRLWSVSSGGSPSETRRRGERRRGVQDLTADTTGENGHLGRHLTSERPDLYIDLCNCRTIYLSDC
jgi:hypothetical protein